MSNSSRTIPAFYPIIFGLTLLLLITSACNVNPEMVYEADKEEEYDHAAVVTGHPLASEVGKEILESGGNAVDAAVAVQFTLAVVYPRAGNLGGGGFMVYRANDGTTAALDYREKAPAAANRDMYLDEEKNPIDGLSTKGHLAAGVPGTVAGLMAAHERYGKLPWARLVQPAIDLAWNGFSVTETEAERLNSFQEAFQEFNDPDCPFIKEEWKKGDELVQTNLAITLNRIREGKAAGFYQGENARLIINEMKSGGGLITYQDLLDYQPVWREAITGTYDDYRIISMPPSSSGGVALLQMLNMVDWAPLRIYGFQSIEATHLMVEAERRAYADRAEYLGDSDFYEVPIESLIDKKYLISRMQDFSADTASTSGLLTAGDFRKMKESFETTHTSIVDAEGNAVSLTTTLNSNFGCKVVVDGAGFFLNNEMDDFSVKPGTPNQFGLVGAEANAIKANKRMLSSMTPTIIEKNGELFMVLGAPGGSTIITAVFQVFINVVEFDMPLEDAIAAPRFHHQWLPDEILVEPNAVDPAVRDSLQAMGHKFREINRMAVVKAIQKLPDGGYVAAGDPRNPDDDVSGY